jgi:murein DD-endopeptidase MepM/ murein hydrolase activator NlpD
MLNQESSSLKNAQPTTAVWPLPELAGRRPVLLVFDPHDHGRIDLAYERRAEPEGALVHAAKRGDDALFTLPSMTPVFAVSDGVIIYAARQLHGHAVIIDHGQGWLTFYGQLQAPFTTAHIDRRPWRRDRVRAGDLIGFAGSPERSQLRTLRFEMWKLDDEYGYRTIDPIRYMRRWTLRSWADTRTIDVPPQQAA